MELDHLIKGLGFLECRLELEHLNVDYLITVSPYTPRNRGRKAHIRGQEIEQGTALPRQYTTTISGISIYSLDEPRELPSHRVEHLEF